MTWYMSIGIACPGGADFPTGGWVEVVADADGVAPPELAVAGLVEPVWLTVLAGGAVVEESASSARAVP